MKISDFIELLLLASLWGAAFLFLRVAAPVLGPVWLIEFRVLFAGLVLLPILARLQLLGQIRQHFPTLVLIGGLNAALPYSLFAFAASCLPAGFTSILNATTPLFGIVVASLYLKENNHCPHPRLRFGIYRGGYFGGMEDCFCRSQFFPRRRCRISCSVDVCHWRSYYQIQTRRNSAVGGNQRQFSGGGIGSATPAAVYRASDDSLCNGCCISDRPLSTLNGVGLYSLFAVAAKRWLDQNPDRCVSDSPLCYVLGSDYFGGNDYPLDYRRLRVRIAGNGDRE